MSASDGRLVGDVAGEVEVEDGVLIIKRIHVSYTLKASEAEREAAERAHRLHALKCPIAKTLTGAVQITTSLNITAPDPMP